MTWNASEAARQAGYRGDPNTIGPRLLANVGIQEAIQERIKESAMQANEVLKRLADVARVNIADFVRECTIPVVDKEGNLIQEIRSFELDWDRVRERGHLIKSITATSNGPKIEVHDPLHALITIGKGLGTLKEPVEHSGEYILKVIRGDAKVDDDPAV